MTKTLYIIAGPNGAGKTTAAKTLLPDLWQCREFVNADEIARGLSPFNPESVAVAAGKLMLRRVYALLEGSESFSIETTLATRSYIELVRRAHERGFRVTLLFFWLESPEMARLRVAQRVEQGGHFIPDEVISRRYQRGVRNLFELFIPAVDEWMIYDNSVSPVVCVAHGNQLSKDVQDYPRFARMREGIPVSPSRQ